MERILTIEEKDFKLPSDGSGNSGFIITTDAQQILLYIDNGQSCCEEWGYLMSQDDFTDFIGAVVLSVTAVDEALGTYEVPEIYEGGMMFINIETSKGTLQFTAYNDHNGYYSHGAGVVSKQLTQEEYL
tara:strand:- start:44 stop:430 length:387 start_codon:yes stop_codon:yes gene_type:complete